MKSIISIHDGIKGSTCGYQNYNTSEMLVFGGYMKVRKSLYTLVIIWVDIILNHIDIKKTLPR